MSGNKLLAENTIRRFMKLASVDTMTDNFISEMGMKYKKDEEEENLEEEAVTEEEEVNEEDDEVNEDINALFEEEDEEEDMEMDLDAGEPEMDAAAPAMDEPEMGAADMSLTEEEAQLLIDLGKRLGEAIGGEMGEEPEMDMDEPEMDMDEPEMDAPADEEDEEVMQEALVNEVLKRVTKRIVAAKLQNRK